MILDTFLRGHVLRKRGNRYTGLCPFHPDTVPSLFVNPKTQYFLCFGCMAEGSASEFLRLFEAIPKN
jgi:DNA primase